MKPAMTQPPASRIILMADDDEDDRLLVRDAFREIQLAQSLDFVEDGEELLDYLHRRGKYQGLAAQPMPILILLDLNMPRKNGHEALKEIKADPSLRAIPVVILSSSRKRADVLDSYGLGANSFVSKPTTYELLLEAMGVLKKYWFDIAELPEVICGTPRTKS